MSQVLFVCLGNICRSTMAEAVMRKKVQDTGLSDQIKADSAGTSSWEAGSPPHRGTQQLLDQKGVSAAGICARQITQNDFQQQDYILAMDRANYRDLLQIAPPEYAYKVHLFLEEAQQEVPDPYYTGDFEETYRLVDLGTDQWLKKLIE